MQLLFAQKIYRFDILIIWNPRSFNVLLLKMNNIGNNNDKIFHVSGALVVML